MTILRAPSASVTKQASCIELSDSARRGRGAQLKLSWSGNVGWWAESGEVPGSGVHNAACSCVCSSTSRFFVVGSFNSMVSGDVVGKTKLGCGYLRWAGRTLGLFASQLGTPTVSANVGFQV